ncbi:MAG: zinc dependent phospholipase C family protein [Bacilli bacterium]
MPAFYTHYYLGTCILKKLNQELLDEINQYRNYFDIGLQGPDIFFFYKPLNKNEITTYGNNIHKNTFNNYLKSIDFNNLSLQPATKVYLYGYVLHFILDTILHPTVNKYASTFSEHMFFEMKLDYYLLKKAGINKPNHFKRSKLIVINESMGSDLKDLFPLISEKDILESIKGMKLYLSLLYSPYHIKRLLLKEGLKLFKIDSDFSNLIIYRGRFRHCNDVFNRIVDSFDEITNLSYLAFINFINSYDNKMPLEIIFDQYFDNYGNIYYTF